MVGWLHCLNGYELEQTPGDSEGQGRLACCSSWDHKESETTEPLKNNIMHWQWTLSTDGASPICLDLEL